MKFQSTVIGVIASFYFYAIAAADGSGNYICNKDYLPFKLVSGYVKDSCNSLKYADISNKYPVAFDGSVHFGIQDAILFATPTRKDNVKNFAGGNVRKYRVVIDSMCNFIGLVYVVDQSYKRCIKILDTIDEPWSTSKAISNTIPKTYGYNCDFRIFLLEETIQYYRRLKPKISSLNSWESRRRIIQLTTNEFAENFVYLWPILINGALNENTCTFRITLSLSELRPDKSLDKLYTICRIVVDKDYTFMGMVYQKNTTWKRCTQIEYLDPEPPRSLDPKKNSIGERLFENVSAYKCDDIYISAISINSHMQAACKSIQEDARKVLAEQFLKVSPHIAPGNREGYTRMWPIRQVEFPIILTGTRKWSYYIKLDLECNFLGVYLRLHNSYQECGKDEPSSYPVKERPTPTCLNLFPH